MDHHQGINCTIVPPQRHLAAQSNPARVHGQIVGIQQAAAAENDGVVQRTSPMNLLSSHDPNYLQNQMMLMMQLEQQRRESAVNRDVPQQQFYASISPEEALSPIGIEAFKNQPPRGQPQLSSRVRDNAALGAEQSQLGTEGSRGHSRDSNSSGARIAGLVASGAGAAVSSISLHAAQAATSNGNSSQTQLDSSSIPQVFPIVTPVVRKGASSDTVRSDIRIPTRSDPSDVSSSLKRAAPNDYTVPQRVNEDSQVKSSMDTASLLHNACKLYPETLDVVESALQMDPGAIRRKIQIVCANTTTQVSSEKVGNDHYKKRQAFEKYHYPINIALKHNASIDVIDLLLRAGPDVLAEKDGPDESSTLAIAIELDKGIDIIKRVLQANPKSARTVDRHANTALHILVRSPASSTLDAVRLVYRAYPQALKLQNFHRHTPLDVAVRKEVCSEDVVDLLHSQVFEEMEEKANHLDDLVE